MTKLKDSIRTVKGLIKLTELGKEYSLINELPEEYIPIIRRAIEIGRREGVIKELKEEWRWLKSVSSYPHISHESFEVRIAVIEECLKELEGGKE